MTYILPHILGFDWEEVINNDETGVCYVGIMYKNKKYGQVIIYCPTEEEERIKIVFYDIVYDDNGDFEFKESLIKYINNVNVFKIE